MIFKSILFAVLLSVAAPEVEGRRLVLKGRRTVTRHYYSTYRIDRGDSTGNRSRILFKSLPFFSHSVLKSISGESLLPAWLVIVLVAIAEILVGVVLYFVLRKMVLSKTNHRFNTYQPAQIEESA